MRNQMTLSSAILVIGGVVAWLLASFAPEIAGALGWGIFIVCFFLLFPSRKSGKLPSRLSVAAMLLVGGLMTGFANDESERAVQGRLEAARAEGPETYFDTVRELLGERAWLEALEQEAPDLYQATVAEIERERAAERSRALLDRERTLACSHVERWLMEEGTRQYQANAAPGVRVLSVSSGRCVATVRADGNFDVHVEGIEVALRGRDNPYDLEADAVVRADDPETEEIERAVCRIAWGSFDWAETSAGC